MKTRPKFDLIFHVSLQTDYLTREIDKAIVFAECISISSGHPVDVTFHKRAREHMLIDECKDSVCWKY